MSSPANADELVELAAVVRAHGLGGDVLLKLFNPGQMRIEATVRESLVGSIRLGQTLRVRIDALERDATAVVEEIVPAADPSSRTFVLKARLAEVDGMFPGMFARLFVPVAPQSQSYFLT